MDRSGLSAAPGCSRGGNDIAEPNPIRTTRTRPPGALLLVGEPARRAPVRRALELRGLRVRELDDVDAACRALEAATGGVVLVAGRSAPGLGAALRRLADADPGLSLFAVIDGDMADDWARELYGCGAAGVFAWNRDADVFARVVVELLRVEAREGRAPERERRLGRAVRARLAGSGGAGPPRPRLAVRVEAGLARLSGRVESLFHRLKLAERAARAPGVARVAASGLRVAPTGIPDHEIAGSLRALLRGAASAPGRTISVDVRGGVATALGTVASDAERSRLSELIGRTPGVREVDNRAVVDAAAQRADAEAALALERRLGTLFDEPGLQVAVHGCGEGGVAVLDGTVARASQRLAAQRVAHDAPVARVENRIRVAPRAVP